ncbi:MAG: hypothetical protein WC405_19770 [Syntrophales bacterium]
MAIPDKNIVQTILEPFEPEIDRCIRKAFQDWREIKKVHNLLYNRTRATVVHDRTIYWALDIFPAKQDIKIIQKYETAWFLANNANHEAIFRFKKGHGLGFSRNLPTINALAFHDPDHNTLWPEAHRVEIVYLLNILKTKIDRILVVARNGKQLVWTYPIIPQAVVDIPSIPTSQSSTDNVLRPIGDTEETVKAVEKDRE